VRVEKSRVGDGHCSAARMGVMGVGWRRTLAHNGKKWRRTALGRGGCERVREGTKNDLKPSFAVLA
jgi:hypothetical protein